MPTTQTMRLRFTTIGAIVGGVITFLWSDLLTELLLVGFGAAAGWALFYALAVISRQIGDEAEVYDRAVTAAEDRSKDELYERARRLDIEGRSTMTKDELAAAVASVEVREEVSA